MQRLAAIYALFYSLNICLAQTNVDYSNLHFENLTTDNGLSDNNVKCLLQDKQGCLWFGTTNGLNRYDGSGFKIFSHIPNDSASLNSNSIEAIFEDSKGQLWVSTLTGLSIYNSSSHQFKNISDDPDNKFAVPSKGITGFAEDKNGIIWMSCHSRDVFMIRYDPKQKIFKGYKFSDIKNKDLKSNSVFNLLSFADAVVLDKDGTVLLSGPQGIISFNTLNSTFNFLDIPSVSLLTAKRFIFKDAGNNIWINMNHSGIARLNTTTKTTETFCADTSIENSDLFTCLVNKTQNEIWFGSKSRGIVIFNTQTHTCNFVQHKDEPYSIPAHAVITSGLKDRSGIIWFGSKKGIIKYDPANNQFITYPPLCKNSSEDDHSFSGGPVIKDDSTGILYVSNASNDGIYSYNPAKGIAQVFHPPGRKGAQNIIANMIRLHTGELVVQFNDTIYFFNPYAQTWSLFNYKLPFHISENIFSIFEDSRNNLWIGSVNNGAYVINREKNSYTYYPIDSINNHAFPEKGAGMEYEDKWGRIWFITLHGFCYFDPSSQSFIKPQLPADFPKGQDLFREACPDKKGNVWIANYKKCLVRYRVNDNSFHYYDLNNGLPDLYLKQMFVDANDHLWIQGNNIIHRYDPDKNKFTSYSQREGIYAGSGIKSITGSNNNELYITFDNDRICMANIDELKSNLFIPPVVISTLKVFDKEIPLANNTVTLTHAQNYLSIQFAALSYSHPEKNKFAYRLNGIDKDWNYSDNRNFASYADLDPGNYVFHVKACNSDGTWNEKGTLIKLVIQPAWWQTLVFRLFIIVLAGVMIWLMIREYTARKLRLQKIELDKQRAVENIRNRISRDMHDEIGSSLTKISLMSELLKSKVKVTETETIVSKITASSRNVIGNMSEIIWATNPQHDNLESMIAYFRDYAAQFFNDTTIHCTVKTPEELISKSVSPELRRNLLLVLKETLNNILKHAGASNVLVEINIQNEQLVMLIKDDGKGFDVNEEKKFSNGLKNMKKRMEEVDGVFEIKSEIGKGTDTRVIIEV